MTKIFPSFKFQSSEKKKEEKIPLRTEPSSVELKTDLVTEPSVPLGIEKPALRQDLQPGDSELNKVDESEKLIASQVDRALAGQRKKIDPLAPLYHLNQLVVPQSDRQFTFSSSASLDGLVQIAPQGGTTVIIETKILGPVMETINCPPMAILLIFLGYLAAAYLLPHPILLFSSLVLAVAMPIILSVAATILTRHFYLPALQKMMTTIGLVCASDEIGDSQFALPGLTVPKVSAALHFRADVLCAAFYLFFAFGLHAAAWQYWCQGQYQQCLNLSTPVKILAQAVLGGNSATVGDCNYYRAECLRCLGQLKAADQAYTEAEQAMRPTVAKENPFYADVFYNKGRVAEEMGNYPVAEKNLKAALDIWRRSDLAQSLRLPCANLFSSISQCYAIIRPIMKYQILPPEVILLLTVEDKFNEQQ